MDATRCDALFVGLEALVARYASQRALEMDPIAIPHGYTAPMDREVAAWVAAHLAYGRVAPMLSAIRRALEPLGATPARWLRERSESEGREAIQEALKGWVWRFHTASDLVEWLLAWRMLDAETDHAGVEPHLAGGPLDDQLSRLVQRLRRDLPDTAGLWFTLPDPASGSACKRWRMHLRWMVRTEWPDLGLWTRLDPAELIIPLDTHVARFGIQFGLTNRKTMDGKMAKDITHSLRSLHPSDPLRYDFALAHLGILGDCPANASTQICDTCPMEDVCLRTQKQTRSLR